MRIASSFVSFVMVMVTACSVPDNSVSDFLPQPEITLRHPSSKPAMSVVVIVIDTLRADRFGCGFEGVMPELSELVTDEGTCFSRAFSGSSWTLPGSASIDSGMLPTTHHLVAQERSGAPDEYTVLNPKVRLLPDYIREAGGVSTFATVNWVYDIQSVSERFDANFSPYHGVEDADIDTRTEEEEDARLVQDTPDWLTHMGVTSTASRFLARYQFLSPHWPFCPPTDDSSHWVVEGVDLCAITGSNAIDQNHSNPAFLDGLQNLYDEEAQYTGQLVVDLYHTYEQIGLSESTLFVITADHGEEFYERGTFGHGSTVFWEQSQVPLAFIGSGVPRGTVIDTPVNTIDIVPTVLQILRLPADDRIEGRSLVSLMRGMDASPYRAITQLVGESGVMQSTCATLPQDLGYGEWTYVYNQNLEGAPNLFDADDLEQAENLFGQYPDIEEWFSQYQSETDYGLWASFY